MAEVNLEVALEKFRQRKTVNANKEKVDNGSLRAGAPMYFYCKYCDDSTDVLPEGYFGRPKRICDPCQVLVDNGFTHDMLAFNPNPSPPPPEPKKVAKKMKAKPKPKAKKKKR